MKQTIDIKADSPLLVKLYDGTQPMYAIMQEGDVLLAKYSLASVVDEASGEIDYEPADTKTVLPTSSVLYRNTKYKVGHLTPANMVFLEDHLE